MIPQSARIRISDDDKKMMRKAAAEYKKSLTQEQKDEIKSNRKYDKERREREKVYKVEKKEKALNCKRELVLLTYMKRTDVLYRHHNTTESLNTSVDEAIRAVKELESHLTYHPYIWNYYGEGHNYMSRALLGCIWRHEDFETIYDVPLDGTYIFHTYDTGQRGLGSFHHMTCTGVNQTPHVPHVSPGSLIPITVQ